MAGNCEMVDLRNRLVGGNAGRCEAGHEPA